MREADGESTAPDLGLPPASHPWIARTRRRGEGLILRIPRTTQERKRYALEAAIVAGAYIVTARAGLSLVVAHGSATPVWAPTGIALAALIVFGSDMWPAVMLGAFVANATTPIPIGLALVIAIGNTAEAVIGCSLLRAAGFRTSLDRVRDVVALVGLAAIASTLFSATIGVTASLFAGTIATGTYWTHWVIWWTGDVMGDLLVAPLIIVWVGSWRLRPRGRSLEAVALTCSLAAGSALVFTGGHWVYAYLLFPLLLWAALRFSAHGATIATLVIAATALGRILFGAPLPGVSNLTFAVGAFQAVIGVVGVSLLVLAATTSERERAESLAEHRARLQAYTRRALEREREATGRLEELDGLKTTFLHAVSHDLRTPLTSILGLASTLEHQDPAFPREEARELSHRIVRNARRLHRLVSDLLDFDRLQSGMLGVERTSTDVGALARAVANDVELHDHPLKVDAAEVIADVDAPKVERIVDNLLANAVKHTPSGTEIHLVVGDEPGGVLITVEDRGPGVPKEQRKTIFEPFARATDENTPGTGIGLALVSRFAELHGGRAWVEGRRGGGATFRVSLPTAPSRIGLKDGSPIAVEPAAPETLGEPELMDWFDAPTFQDVFDLCPDAMVIVNRDSSKILAANPAACAMFRMSEPELQAVDPGRLVAISDEDRRSGVADRKERARIGLRMGYLRGDGEGFEATVSSFEFVNARGQTQVLSIMHEEPAGDRTANPS